MDKKLEELAEDSNSYDEEEEESNEDLDSELGDTLDVNDMKYPNMDKDKSSSDIQNGNDLRKPSGASEKYENTQISYTEDASQDSNPGNNKKWHTDPSDANLNLGLAPMTPSPPDNGVIMPGTFSPGGTKINDQKNAQDILSPGGHHVSHGRRMKDGH